MRTELAPTRERQRKRDSTVVLLPTSNAKVQKAVACVLTITAAACAVNPWLYADWWWMVLAQAGGASIGSLIGWRLTLGKLAVTLNDHGARLQLGAFRKDRYVRREQMRDLRVTRRWGMLTLTCRDALGKRVAFPVPAPVYVADSSFRDQVHTVLDWWAAGRDVNAGSRQAAVPPDAVPSAR